VKHLQHLCITGKWSDAWSIDGAVNKSDEPQTRSVGVAAAIWGSLHFSYEPLDRCGAARIVSSEERKHKGFGTCLFMLMHGLILLVQPMHWKHDSRLDNKKWPDICCKCDMFMTQVLQIAPQWTKIMSRRSSWKHIICEAFQTCPLPHRPSHHSGAGNQCRRPLVTYTL
jgi:hypothetical protein